MKASNLKKIIKEIPSLNSKEFRLIEEEMLRKKETKRISTILETPFHKISCPNCDSKEINRWGKRSDMQRYRCKECKRTFNSLTNTPLARLRRKGHWMDYSHCLKEGLTVRQAAIECGVHRNTSFRWRHRFIENSKKIKAKSLAGIIEYSEDYFRESFKGQKKLDPKILNSDRRTVGVLFNIDRSNNIYDYTDTESKQSDINSSIKDIFMEKSLILKSSNILYSNVENLYEFSTLISSEKKDFKSQSFVNIITYKNKFRLWINDHFKGVATKYLENYVSWFRGLEEFNSGIRPITLLFRAKSVEKYRYQPLKLTELYPNLYT